MPQQNRIVGYDFARSLAILGMIFVNFKIVMAGTNPSPNFFTSILNLFEGRAVAIFVVLAGVGLSLLSRHARVQENAQDQKNVRKSVWKRALFLFVVGLLYTPIWPADILHFYGVYLMFGAVVLFVPDRQLWWYSSTIVAGFIVLLFIIDYETGWNFDTLEYVDLWTLGGMLRHLFYNGFHPFFPWAAFMLAGMWLGRQDVGNPLVRQRILRWSVTIAVITELLSIGLISLFANAGEDVITLLETKPLPPTPFYMIASGATAFTIIILSIIVTEHFKNAKWIHPFIASGQMSLTIYVAHVLVGMGFLDMLGRLENHSSLFVFWYAVAFYALALIFAVFWLMKYKRGPLEMLMRSLVS